MSTTPELMSRNGFLALGSRDHRKQTFDIDKSRAAYKLAPVYRSLLPPIWTVIVMARNIGKHIRALTEIFPARDQANQGGRRFCGSKTREGKRKTEGVFRIGEACAGFGESWHHRTRF